MNLSPADRRQLTAIKTPNPSELRKLPCEVAATDALWSWMPFIAHSARRHGVTHAVILHAFMHPNRVEQLVHAMHARSRYLR